MRTPSFSRSSRIRRSGLTVLEVLLAVVLFSGAIALTMDLFFTVAARAAAHHKRELAVKGPERFVAEFTAGLPRAVRSSIYPSRAVYEQAPALCADRGNFVLLTLEDRTLAFELADGALNLREKVGAGEWKEMACASAVSTADSLCQWRDGSIRMEFVVDTGGETFKFAAAGQSLPAQ